MKKYLQIISLISIMSLFVSCIDFWSPAKFNDGTLQHTVYGNFWYKSGGHLQKNLDMLVKLDIPYKETKTFDNGVRVGKIKTIDDSENSQYWKENHAWFPKNWNTWTLKNAVRKIVNEPDNRRLINSNTVGETVRLLGEYKNVSLYVIVRMIQSKDDKQHQNVVITAYPNSSYQPDIPLKNNNNGDYND